MDLFAMAVNNARESSAMVRPQVLDHVYLLWFSGSVLGVYAKVEEARRVAEEIRGTSGLTWDEGPVDCWNGWASETVRAAMSVQRRRIG